MAEYISRDKTINAIKNLESSMPAKDNYAKGYDAALGRALIAIREVHTADVQPVKHGRWINIYEYCEALDLRPSGLETYYWCSECDKAEKKTSDFCPNCGARMGGEDNE